MRHSTESTSRDELTRLAADSIRFVLNTYERSLQALEAALGDNATLVLDQTNPLFADLMQFVKGPDFPTRGVIMGRAGIRAAYGTGRGKITLRGRAEIEEIKNRNCIIIKEIPYMVNKANLIIKIAELVKLKKIEGITEIRDESNKKGVRFVIELAKGINGDVIANKLYRLTELETTYSINQVALVNKTPKLLSFKELVEKYGSPLYIFNLPVNWCHAIVQKKFVCNFKMIATKETSACRKRTWVNTC